MDYVVALDTSAVIRYLTGDDQEKAEEVKKILERGEVYVCGEVILETVYVLMSKRLDYRMPKEKVIELLEEFLTLKNVEIEDKIYLEALELWKELGQVSFADLVVCLKARRKGVKLFSYDEKLRKKCKI